VLLFCSSRYPLVELAAEINACSDGLTVIGCTSSGEITTEGTAEGTITAIGFPASHFTLTAARFDDLDAFEEGAAQGVVRELVGSAVAASQTLGPTVDHAAIFLVDGLSHREEMLTVTVQDALGKIPLIGGSSGDGLAFKETFIFESGQFRRDSALVAILSSSRPLKVFRAQHYRPGSTKMVITGADPAGKPQSFAPADFQFVGADGTAVTDVATKSAATCLRAADEFPTAPVGADQKVAGTVVLDVPATTGTLAYRPASGLTSLLWRF